MNIGVRQILNIGVRQILNIGIRQILNIGVRQILNIVIRQILDKAALAKYLVLVSAQIWYGFITNFNLHQFGMPSPILTYTNLVWFHQF